MFEGSGLTEPSLMVRGAAVRDLLRFRTCTEAQSWCHVASSHHSELSLSYLSEPLECLPPHLKENSSL